MGREFSHRLNTDETQILKKKFRVSPLAKNQFAKSKSEQLMK
jgi:hypothetical protein